MERTKEVAVNAYFGTILIGRYHVLINYKLFARYMLRFPREVLRRKARKYGLPQTAYKEDYIRAIWEDTRNLTLTMRWKP